MKPLADQWRVRVLLCALSAIMLSTSAADSPAGTALQVPEIVTIGLILPLPVTTTVSTFLDVQARGARNGAVMGTDDYAQISDGIQPRLAVTNAPSEAAARRAAERLISVNGVVALVGGIGEGHAAVLSEVAEDHGVLFINVGDQGNHLRATCNEFTFHVEPSRALYVAAMATQISAQGAKRVAVIHQASDEGRREAEALVAQLESLSGVTGVLLGVTEEEIVLQGVLEAVAGVEPDLVVLLVAPEQQEGLLLQADWMGLDLAFMLYPWSETQSRYALASQMLASALASSAPRITTWDTTLGGAPTYTSFNERYMSRFAATADPSAWASYQAVKMLFEATENADSSSPQDLARFLLEAWSGDLGKPSLGRFAQDDRQLIQDLYSIQIDPAAHWTVNVSGQAALASVQVLLNAEAVAQVAVQMRVGCARGD